MVSTATTKTSTTPTSRRPYNYEADREKDKTPVRGIFEFHEVPGGKLEFAYKKYKGDNLMIFKTNKETGEDTAFYDGQMYTIPLGVAKHLNKSGWYAIHSYAQDEKGHVSQKIGQKVRRYSFRSLEFIDIDDLTPEGSKLVTVENV